jgi:prepilin-type N-terminal cleavage/methylation domain-containing protein
MHKRRGIRHSLPRRYPWGFTLIELLVVLAIIGLLAGLLVPAVVKTLGTGKAAGCGSNARQLALAMIAFEGDFQYLPWSNEGYYQGQFDSTGTQTNSTFRGTNWNNKLVFFKYLPSDFDKGVWLCPGATRTEIRGLDQNNNPANYGGYGICNNIFRQENNLSGNNNVAQRPLKLSRIRRPAQTWMVGDCGRPVPKSTPGSGQYLRTANGYGRPSTLGAWDFTKGYSDSQPALRHNGDACWAGFDAHVTKLNWEGMQVETNNFTARGESF